MGKIEMKIEDVAGKTPISVPMARAPYLIPAGLLVASRVFPDFKALLMSLSFGWKDILGESASPARWSRCTCPVAFSASWC